MSLRGTDWGVWRIGWPGEAFDAAFIGGLWGSSRCASTGCFTPLILVQDAALLGWAKATVGLWPRFRGSPMASPPGGRPPQAD